MDVFQTVTNVHKMKTMFTYDVIVCTGENEETTQARTSGLEGKQL